VSRVTNNAKAKKNPPLRRGERREIRISVYLLPEFMRDYGDKHHISSKRRKTFL
jgi:hypothetical protein